MTISRHPPSRDLLHKVHHGFCEVRHLYRAGLRFHCDLALQIIGIAFSTRSIEL
jgi:hypothetical protein